MSGRPVLAFDFGSRAATAAVAADGALRASVESEREARDADLLRLVESCLERAGVGARELGGVVALAGPGSFTGLRVACATALGLGAALGVPAAGWPTLAALAFAVPPGSGRILAVVDALRGEWFAQRFDRGPDGASELEPPRLLAVDDEVPEAALVVGLDADRFVAERGLARETLTAVRLAEAAAVAASRAGWQGDRELLRRPLYLRAPAARPPA
jgi:tRNA threonylcarbamoyladenosine biosynthesis protein TsaB